MSKVFKPGDNIERDPKKEGKNFSKSHFSEGKQLGENVFEWEENVPLISTPKKNSTADDISQNITQEEKVLTALESSSGISAKYISEFLAHIKKYGKKALDQKDVLAQKLSLPGVAVGKLIKILLMILLVAGGTKATYNAFKPHDGIEKVDKKQKHAPVTIDLKELSGYGQTKLSRFPGALVDASDEAIFKGKSTLELGGTLEETVRIVDYKKNLKALWDHKFSRRPDSKKLAAMSGVYKRVITPLTQNEAKFTDYSLDERTTDMNNTINIVNKNIDRDKVCEITGVDKRHKKSLESIFNRMNSKHVLSYTCTELFGDLPGYFSIVYLDFLFRNAGKEYVYYIPAVYDNMASFGPYQLTSAVVRHDDHTKGSANRIQEALPAKYHTIPGSMYKLSPQQQNEATYLNMIYNLGLMFNILEKNNITEAQYEKISKVDMEFVLQYLAVSHNSPRAATKGVVHRVKNNMKKPYDSYVGNKKPYAQRTKKFYDAVLDYSKKHR